MRALSPGTNRDSVNQGELPRSRFRFAHVADRIHAGAPIVIAHKGNALHFASHEEPHIHGNPNVMNAYIVIPIMAATPVRSQ